MMNFMRSFHALPSFRLSPLKLNVRYADEYTTLSAIEGSGNLNPIQKNRLAELRAQGKTGSSDGVESKGNIGNYTPEGAQMVAKKQAMDAIQPAVDTLNAGIPELKDIYSGVRDRLEATRTPLNQRYDALIKSLTDEQTGAVNEGQMTTSRELGRRGVPLSSTLADQQIEGVVNPIRSQFANSISQTGIAQNADNLDLNNQIAGTGDQETQAIRSILNAVSGAQSSAGLGAIQTALQMLNSQQQSTQFEESLGLQKQQLAQAGISRSVVEANGHKYLIDGNTGQIISDLGTSAAPATTGTGVNLGLTTPTTTTTPTAAARPPLSLSNSFNTGSNAISNPTGSTYIPLNNTPQYYNNNNKLNISKAVTAALSGFNGGY